MAGVLRNRVVLGTVLLIAIFSVTTWTTERLTSPGGPRWAVIPHGPLKESENSHLGAEYRAIALSLIEGRGFSNPFKKPTGPTAWMAPLLPVLLASFFCLAHGNEQLVVDIVLSLNSITLGLAALAAIWIGGRRGYTWPGCTAVALVWATDFHAAFQTTNDCWLLIACVSAILVGTIQMPRRPTTRQAVFWGAAGGAIALASPVLGLSWVCATVWRLRFQRTLLTAVAVAALLVTPWIVRCAIVLDCFVPVKSNAPYELWLANCCDADGVLDCWTVERVHPYIGRGPDLTIMTVRGEIPVIKERGTEARKQILANPTGYFARVATRLLAATVYYVPFDPDDENRRTTIAVKRVFYSLPFLSLLLVFALHPRPLPNDFLATTLIYIASLTPYVLLSYNDRYAVPLMPLKAVFVTYGLGLTMERIRRFLGRRSTEGSN